MTNGFKNGCVGSHLVHSGEPCALHPKYRERIQRKLEKFLPVQEAQETATQIYDLALSIDEEIGRILKDPLARRLYEYDGRFFTPRGSGLFHTTFDGLHVLQPLWDSRLEGFFFRREKHAAIKWLLEELGTHAWVAKMRRTNWEESGTLGLVPQEVFDAIIEDVRERRRRAAEGSPPLSPEEQVFFQSFEEEMRDSTCRDNRKHFVEP